MTMRVLVVDDAKTTRDMVMFTLRRAGYDVLQAADGRSALDALDGGGFDCIITDLNMPVMDGLELIHSLRASGPHRNTPILMLTTDNDDARRQAGKRAGATGWVNKPFHPNSLIEAVSDLLREAAAR